jgi:hypothetical protein
MNEAQKAEHQTGGIFAGAAVLMVLCCAFGPAVLGAAAGSIIGGWLGILCAVVLGGSVGVGLYRRRGRGGC